MIKTIDELPEKIKNLNTIKNDDCKVCMLSQNTEENFEQFYTTNNDLNLTAELVKDTIDHLFYCDKDNGAGVFLPTGKLIETIHYNIAKDIIEDQLEGKRLEEKGSKLVVLGGQPGAGKGGAGAKATEGLQKPVVLDPDELRPRHPYWTDWAKFGPSVATRVQMDASGWNKDVMAELGKPENQGYYNVIADGVCPDVGKMIKYAQMMGASEDNKLDVKFFVVATSKELSMQGVRERYERKAAERKSYKDALTWLNGDPNIRPSESVEKVLKECEYKIDTMKNNDEERKKAIEEITQKEEHCVPRIVENRVQQEGFKSVPEELEFIWQCLKEKPEEKAIKDLIKENLIDPNTNDDQIQTKIDTKYEELMNQRKVLNVEWGIYDRSASKNLFNPLSGKSPTEVLEERRNEQMTLVEKSFYLDSINQTEEWMKIRLEDPDTSRFERARLKSEMETMDAARANLKNELAKDWLKEARLLKGINLD